MDEEVHGEVVVVVPSVATVVAIVDGVVGTHPIKRGASAPVVRSPTPPGLDVTNSPSAIEREGTSHSGHPECLAYLTSARAMVLSGVLGWLFGVGGNWHVQ